jgi:hypothetical protein
LEAKTKVADDPYVQIEISTVGMTQYASGFLGYQPVPLGDGGTMQMGQGHSLPGFASRPRDPDTQDGHPTTAPNMLLFHEGQEVHVLPLEDPRTVPLLPQDKQGGSTMYAHRDDGDISFVQLDGSNGNLTVYVPYGSTSMVITIDVSNPGAENIQIRHGAGMGISMVAGGNNSLILNNKAGDAYIEIGDNGITFGGKVNHVGSFNVGIPSPLEIAPPPLPPDSVVLGGVFTTWVAALTAAGNALSPTPLVVPPFVLGTSTKFKAA